MGRTDDIINVAGHRLSTGGMEEVLAAHQDVAECAVVGIADALKGEVPAGFVVLKAGVNRPAAEIEQECCGLIREKIGPVASFKLAMVVARLPKTRSGKILRGTMKKIADGAALDHAGDHRRSRDPRRDRRRAEGQGRGWLMAARPLSQRAARTNRMRRVNARAPDSGTARQHRQRNQSAEAAARIASTIWRGQAGYSTRSWRDATSAGRRERCDRESLRAARR